MLAHELLVLVHEVLDALRDFHGFGVLQVGLGLGGVVENCHLLDRDVFALGFLLADVGFGLYWRFFFYFEFQMVSDDLIVVNVIIFHLI